jgi:hypothetical protein
LFSGIKASDLLYLGYEIKINYIFDIVAISYFTVLENRKTSKDTGKNRWLPTLRVGACLSCVWAFCGASKADIGLTRAFLWILFPNQITFSSICQLQNFHYQSILSLEVS